MAGTETAVDTTWLSDTEAEAWRSLLAVVVQLPGVLSSQLQRDSGIGMFEYIVLSGLSMSDDRMLRMSALAEFANGSLSRLSNVVKRLEQQGWVRRQPDPTDGRYTVALLTDAGWDKVVAAAPGHVRAARQLVFDPLTDEQVRQLADTASLIAAQLRCGLPPEVECGAASDPCGESGSTEPC